MNAHWNEAAAQALGTPHANRFDWRAALARVVSAWKARVGYRRDGDFHRARNEHERFLSNATDHYDLERLERAWQRRRSDLWRVY